MKLESCFISVLLACSAPPAKPPEVTGDYDLCFRYCSRLETCDTLPPNCEADCLQVISDREIESTTEFRASISNALGTEGCRF